MFRRDSEDNDMMRLRSVSSLLVAIPKGASEGLG